MEERAFWACVRDGIPPPRGAPAVPAEALPAEVVHLLVTRVGLSEAEVAGMTRADAVARLARDWTEGPDPGLS